LDRVGALGDGQIPAVVAAAWRRMMIEAPPAEETANEKVQTRSP
jgi:hypothetical protein